MKKFSKLIFFMVIACCFLIVGCSSKPLTMPNGDYVSSNGGFVVGVGDYMYFSNAYNSYENLKSKSDNNGAKVAQHSMKRTKIELLDEHNYVMNISKNEEENIVYEKVINKIAGYETSNMFVVNKYLYFTSPNVHKNKENKYEFNLTTLFRLKLDGTGLTEICTTEAEKATFYLTGGENKKILIYDDNKLKVVNASSNSTKVETWAKDVANLVFPKNFEKEIVNLYFTQNKEEGEKGNILKSINLQTKEIKEISNYVKNGETLNIIAYENNRLFYTITGGDYDAFYSNDFSKGSSSEQIHRYVIEGLDSSNFAYIVNEENNTDCFVLSYGDKLYVQDITDDNGSKAVEITSDKATVKYVYNSYIIYTTETGIYKYSVKDRNEAKTITEIENLNADHIDYDGKYVYFFAKAEKATTDTYYLYRANTFASEIETECIGELLEEDIVEDKEETEE